MRASFSPLLRAAAVIYGKKKKKKNVVAVSYQSSGLSNQRLVFFVTSSLAPSLSRCDLKSCFKVTFSFDHAKTGKVTDLTLISTPSQRPKVSLLRSNSIILIKIEI